MLFGYWDSATQPLVYNSIYTSIMSWMYFCVSSFRCTVSDSLVLIGMGICHQSTHHLEDFWPLAPVTPLQAGHKYRQSLVGTTELRILIRNYCGPSNQIIYNRWIHISLVFHFQSPTGENYGGYSFRFRLSIRPFFRHIDCSDFFSDVL